MTKSVVKSKTLPEWIEELGTEEFGKLLRTNRVTVYNWKKLRTLPRSKQMQKIVHYSRGAVSYETMVDTYHGKLNQKSNRS